MIDATKNPNLTRDYDPFLEMIIKSIKNSIKKKNDDFLMMCIGTTGTGKSSLMLHVLELFCGESASLESICMTRETFADKQLEVSKVEGDRFLGNDETDADKRSALSKWNRDLLTLYFKNRGQNILHWWNNPSLEMIDKEFIEERIKGLIFITTKDKVRPRVYYYFRKEDMLKLFYFLKSKRLKLSLPIIKKNAKRFAYAKGWFKAYNGRFADEYFNKLKQEGMQEHSLKFKEKYGTKNDEKKIFRKDIASYIGVGVETIVNYEKELVNDGELIPEHDFTLLPSGKKAYNQNVLEKFKDIAEKKRENMKKGQFSSFSLENMGF